MSFEEDNNIKAPQGDEAVQWTKEEPAKSGGFGFDAFLSSDSLEERVSKALEKKDAPTGQPAPARPAPERGRHEAPGPVEDQEPEGDAPAGDEGDDLTADLPTRKEQPMKDPVFRTVYDREKEGPAGQPRRQPAQEQPLRRQAVPEAPPRPKVVVADPTPPPRVYVQPPRQYDEPPRGGGSGGRNGGGGSGFLKWLVAILITAAVLLGGYLFAREYLLADPSASPSPVPTGDVLTATLPPRPTNAPTAPPKNYHTITVTAGSGGSVSPSGSVDVEEGTSQSFIITPDLGYELSQLLIDGANVNIQTAYTFDNVRQNHTLYAVFQPLAAAPATEPPPTDTPAPTAEPTAPPTEVPVTPEPVITEPPVTPEPAPPMEEGMVSDLGPAAE